MGSWCDYAENKALDLVLGVAAWSSPTAVYLALSTTDFTDTGGSGTEPVGNGYARTAITFGAPVSRVITQNADVEFPQATGSWGTIGYWAIFDASTGGNALAYGSFGTAKAVDSGKTVTVPSGQITITGTAGDMSDYLAHALLNHAFRNTALTAPTIYVALCEAAILDSSTGSTIDELDMTGYAREAHSSWNAASGGAVDNNGVIDFGTLTGTGETVEAACLVDAASGGNILWYDNDPAVSVGDGDTVQIASGAFDITLT